MADNSALFTDEWQDFFREILQEDALRQQLSSFLQQREHLIDEVVARAQSKGLKLDKQTSDPDFLSRVFATSAAKAQNVAESDVKPWLDSSLPYSSFVVG